MKGFRHVANATKLTGILLKTYKFLRYQRGANGILRALYKAEPEGGCQDDSTD
jgi:hypothetical protein